MRLKYSACFRKDHCHWQRYEILYCLIKWKHTGCTHHMNDYSGYYEGWQLTRKDQNSTVTRTNSHWKVVSVCCPKDQENSLKEEGAGEDLKCRCRMRKCWKTGVRVWVLNVGGLWNQELVFWNRHQVTSDDGSWLLIHDLQTETWNIYAKDHQIGINTNEPAYKTWRGTIEDQGQWTETYPLIEGSGQKEVFEYYVCGIFNTLLLSRSRDRRGMNLQKTRSLLQNAHGGICKNTNCWSLFPSMKERTGWCIVQHCSYNELLTSTYLNKLQNLIPHTSGFWESSFKPISRGILFSRRYAKWCIYLCDRRISWRCALPRFKWCWDRIQSICYGRWSVTNTCGSWNENRRMQLYFMGCINRVGQEKPWNLGKFYGSSYFVDPRGQIFAPGIRGLMMNCW